MRWQRADVIGVALMLIVSAVFYRWNRETLQPKRYTPMCQSNLKQVGLGMMQYIRDYDERMPLRTNWVDALQPYTKSTPIFECPARGELESGYAMFQRVAGINLSQIDNPALAVMVFDADARGLNVTATPAAWPKPFRHPDGNNVLFIDGHVALRASARFDFKIGPTPTPYPLPKKK